MFRKIPKFSVAKYNTYNKNVARNVGHTFTYASVLPSILHKIAPRTIEPIFKNTTVLSDRYCCKPEPASHSVLNKLNLNCKTLFVNPAFNNSKKYTSDINDVEVKTTIKEARITYNTAGKYRKFIRGGQYQHFTTDRALRGKSCVKKSEKVNCQKAKKKRKNPKKKSGPCPYIKEECKNRAKQSAAGFKKCVKLTTDPCGINKKKKGKSHCRNVKACKKISKTKSGTCGKKGKSASCAKKTKSDPCAKSSKSDSCAKKTKAACGVKKTKSDSCAKKTKSTCGAKKTKSDPCAKKASSKKSDSCAKKSSDKKSSACSKAIACKKKSSTKASKKGSGQCGGKKASKDGSDPCGGKKASKKKSDPCAGKKASKKRSDPCAKIRAAKKKSRSKSSSCKRKRSDPCAGRKGGKGAKGAKGRQVCPTPVQKSSKDLPEWLTSFTRESSASGSGKGKCIDPCKKERGDPCAKKKKPKKKKSSSCAKRGDPCKRKNKPKCGGGK